jgi:hypothetical protein
MCDLVNLTDLDATQKTGKKTWFDLKKQNNLFLYWDDDILD